MSKSNASISNNWKKFNAGRINMDQGFAVVIGMTISYFFSLLGLIFAWVYYARNKKKSSKTTPS